GLDRCLGLVVFADALVDAAQADRGGGRRVVALQNRIECRPGLFVISVQPACACLLQIRFGPERDSRREQQENGGGAAHGRRPVVFRSGYSGRGRNTSLPQGEPSRVSGRVLRECKARPLTLLGSGVTNFSGVLRVSPCKAKSSRIGRPSESGYTLATPGRGVV